MTIGTRPGENLLAIVCRNPEVGAVKTRLIPALGAEGARSLYRAFLQDLDRRFRDGPHTLAWAYTPEGGPLPDGLVGGMRLKQRGPTLSHRLLGIFEQAAAEGYRRAVVISSDVPHLPARVVRDAFAALDDHDEVFAPSEDGGYHLVGMAAPHDVFTMVQMSTPSVLRETLAAGERLALRIRLLEGDFDVDLPEDLPRLAARLADDGTAGASPSARRLRELGIRPAVD